MADGLLPYLFSRSNAFRRNLIDIVSNPADYAAKMGGQVVDTGNELAELQERSGMFGAGPVDEAARDELYQRAADAAMNVAGMMIGPGSKLFQRDAAFEAQKMLKGGVDPKEVWRKTGTAKTGEGAYKQEISDKGSQALVGKMIIDPMTGYRETPLNYPLEVLFRHNKLMEAYPELRSTYASSRIGPEEGFFDQATKELFASGENKDALRRVFLHELQHAIQKEEGFARGASSKMFEKGQPLARFKRPNESPYDAYERMAGEAEARMVMRRADLTDKQRRELYPFQMGEYGYDIHPRRLMHLIGE